MHVSVAAGRLLDMFGDVVMGVHHSLFEEALEELKEKKGVYADNELTAADLKELVVAYKEVYKKVSAPTLASISCISCASPLRYPGVSACGVPGAKFWRSTNRPLHPARLRSRRGRGREKDVLSEHGTF